MGNWKNPTGSERVIIRKGEKLWLRTTKPDDVDNQDAGYLLTDKLEHFSFELNNVTKDWPDAVKDTKTTKGYVTNPISVHIDIGLAYRKKTTKNHTEYPSPEYPGTGNTYGFIRNRSL